jgi:hypothetical protein
MGGEVSSSYEHGKETKFQIKLDAKCRIMPVEINKQQKFLKHLKKKKSTTLFDLTGSAKDK